MTRKPPFGDMDVSGNVAATLEVIKSRLDTGESTTYRRADCSLAVWRRGCGLVGLVRLGRFTGRVREVYAHRDDAAHMVALIDGIDRDRNAARAMDRWKPGRTLASKQFNV